jgi:SRSO17 transposase
MAVYLRGLLSETERKNGWTLAEAAGDGGPQGMQRLLNFYAWDAEEVRDDVRVAVVQALGDDAERAAKALGIARQTVLHKVQRGQLRAVYVNRGRRKGLRIQVEHDQPGLFDTP